jgi:methionyl-tRNA synthetase
MENITFADFQKLDIRVAEIKFAEEVPGADKLYKLIIDVGGVERILVAGIKQYYPTEELPGKKVLILANLEPKVIRGIESYGMILCAHNEDRSQLTLSTVQRDIVSGAKVS